MWPLSRSLSRGGGIIVLFLDLKWFYHGLTSALLEEHSDDENFPFLLSYFFNFSYISPFFLVISLWWFGGVREGISEHLEEETFRGKTLSFVIFDGLKP